VVLARNDDDDDVFIRKKTFSFTEQNYLSTLQRKSSLALRTHKNTHFVTKQN